MHMMRDFFDSILNTTISVPDMTFAEIWQILLNVIQHPRENVSQTLALLSLPFFVVLLIAVVLLIIFLPDDKEYYEDDESKDEQASVPGLTEKEKLAFLSGGNTERARQIMLFNRYWTWLFVIGIFAIFWVGTGVVSRLPSTCNACHGEDEHSLALAHTGHANTWCVGCHENVGFVASLGMPQVQRLEHTVFNRGSSQVYASAPDNASCLRCHDEVLERALVHMTGERRTRISHKQPYEAGLDCIGCHTTLGQNAARQTVHDKGMQSCIGCHEGVTASNECSFCHITDPYFTRTTLLESDAQILVRGPFDQQCYRCHDPGPCDSCHFGVRMPHPPYSDPGHDPESLKVGGDACLGCHSRERDCNSCHFTDRWTLD